MHTWTAFLFLFISLALATPLLTPAVEERTLDQIYRAALKENGPLRVNWGGDVKASGEGIAKAFKARFPGINIDLRLDLSKYLDGEIDRTYKATSGKDDGADVAVIQALHAFPRWKAQGRLLPYKVSQWNDIYPQFVDQDGAYIGCYICHHVRIPHLQPKNDGQLFATHNLSGFPQAEWSEKLILTYPNDDDAILYLFNLITEKYGFNFIESLSKQKVQWVRGTATPSILIANANNADAANACSVSFASSSAFAPGIASEAQKDIYMAWPQTGAIFASTKVPESAKLFMNFLMDDHWQTLMSRGRFATRRKFDGAGILKQSNVDPLGYGKFMADRQTVEALRLQFESIIGTAQGQNPVDEY
ncbi:hypothetical protein BDZ97DRAFT_1932562 [Flammula alnicola]|nr:hypothetical protein BDZ97DRAFT_1932562 [Flammula alnicola]